MHQQGSKSRFYTCFLLDCNSSNSEAAKIPEELPSLNRKDESHQQEQSTQGNTGWEISQEGNYVMDVYTVGKSAEQQRQHLCIDKKEKTIYWGQGSDLVCNLRTIDYICEEFFGSGMRGAECICAVCCTMSVNSARMFKIISLKFDSLGCLQMAISLNMWLLC